MKIIIDTAANGKPKLTKGDDYRFSVQFDGDTGSVMRIKGFRCDRSFALVKVPMLMLGNRAIPVVELNKAAEESILAAVRTSLCIYD